MQAQVIEPTSQQPSATALHLVHVRRRPESIEQLMERVAIDVADTADADQWAIEVDGVERTGPASFDDLVPHAWLIALNGGRPAVYNVSFPLEAAGRRLGVLRLSTLRPTGFRPADLAHARREAAQAADRLAAALR